MKVLYEIFVPTRYGDNNKPIRTAHHKQWDKFVQKITGGLTILGVAKGKWTHEGVEYPERIIPVRVMVEEKCVPLDPTEPHGAGTMEHEQIKKIILYTALHYRQKAVMYFEVTRNVQVFYT